MICFPEILTSLLDSLHEYQQLPNVYVVVLFITSVFSRVDVKPFENSESDTLAENTGNCKSSGISLRNSLLCWFVIIEALCISAGLFPIL